MMRVMNMLKRPLKKYIKPIMPAVIGAVVFAMFTMGIFMAADWVTYVPSVTTPLFGWVIVPLRVVFLTALIVGVVIGGTYLLYRKNRERIHNYWQQYSTWAKSMITGTVTTIFAAIALYITYAIEWITLSSVALGVLLTWPLVVATVLLGYRQSSRAPNATASLKTAYVLTRGLESRTVSVIIGLLVAIGSGLAIRAATNWYFDYWPLWATVWISTVILLLVTVLVYNQYDKTKVERTDLTIIRITTPDSRDGKEITIKNTAGESVNLAESLIRDTDLDLYRPGFNYTLRPGEYGTFEIDDDFALEPNDDAIKLPLGYDLKRGGETPAIFTKDGEIHYLQWTEGPAETIDRESSKHTAESVLIPDDIPTPTRVTNPSVEASPQD